MGSHSPRPTWPSSRPSAPCWLASSSSAPSSPAVLARTIPVGNPAGILNSTSANAPFTSPFPNPLEFELTHLTHTHTHTHAHAHDHAHFPPVHSPSRSSGDGCAGAEDGGAVGAGAAADRWISDALPKSQSRKRGSRRSQQDRPSRSALDLLKSTPTKEGEFRSIECPVKSERNLTLITAVRYAHQRVLLK
jgi:hypothetical protein